MSDTGRGVAGPLPSLPRAPAVERLADALERAGLGPLSAAAAARAAVRPDDFRRRLSAPVELRVPGGVMDVVETPVWAPAVVPYPTNPRELGRRIYPLGIEGDVPADQRLIEDPRAAALGTCELEIRVGSRSQLVFCGRSARPIRTKAPGTPRSAPTTGSSCPRGSWSATGPIGSAGPRWTRQSGR
ncbi:MAG: hypothetical protein LC789_13470 [Actinobacteria bacterium]|nr:hypothetical protein [Actinomycetota bacterium]